MAPGPVVEDFSAIEGIGTNQNTGFIHTFSYMFFFPSAKDRLRHGNIPVVAYLVPSERFNKYCQVVEFA